MFLKVWETRYGIQVLPRMPKIACTNIILEKIDLKRTSTLENNLYRRSSWLGVSKEKRKVSKICCRKEMAKKISKQRWWDEFPARLTSVRRGISYGLQSLSSDKREAFLFECVVWACSRKQENEKAVRSASGGAPRLWVNHCPRDHWK